MTDERERADDQPSVKVVDRRWWAQQGETADTAGTNAEAVWQPGKPTYVEDLERQLAEKDRLYQELLAKYREASREFDDARARLRKDVARDVERGRRTMLVELLDVVDNLDRAIEAARNAAPTDAIVSGVEMVRRLFLAKLEGFGVTRVDAIGQRFDPARHEAVTMVPTRDPAQDGIICGVMSPGYLVGDEVLRPAMVAVSQFAGEETSAR
jgi:molecular chaperone GrpE